MSCLDLDKKLISFIGVSSLEYIQHLIDIGADVNSYEGLPLRRATELNHFNIAKLLIENGADVNICDGYPLYLSVDYNHFNITKLLIDNGADINYLNTKDVKKFKIEAFLKGDMEFVKLLMEGTK